MENIVQFLFDDNLPQDEFADHLKKMLSAGMMVLDEAETLGQNIDKTKFKMIMEVMEFSSVKLKNVLSNEMNIEEWEKKPKLFNELFHIVGALDVTLYLMENYKQELFVSKVPTTLQ